MIVAKSEKTSFGNTAVLYWDNNKKKYQLNLFDSSDVTPDIPVYISGSLEKSHAFEIFDRVVLGS